ncbi:MAG: MFS transporter [Treponema sp.]|nr:MFS transporter [Treponema sp.]
MKKTSALRYSVGMFGGSLPFNMFTAFMAFYYVDALGLDMRIYASSLIIYAILDAIDNPIYGFLSDRTRTRFGRRKPWLLAASVVFVICFVAFFSPPSRLEGGAFIAYFIATMLLVQTVMSMIQVNYNALLPDLFRTVEARAKANSMRQAWMFAATILGVALTPVIAGAIGYPLTAAVFGAVSLVALLTMATGIHEDPDYRNYKAPAILPSIKEILSNRKFWLVAAVSTLYGAAQAILLAAIPFYIAYALELDGASASALLGTVFVTAAVMLFPWAAAVRRFSLLAVWRLSLLLLALSFLPFYFANSLAVAIIGGFFVGAALGGIVTTNDIVVALLLDEDRERHGQRREGTFQSILNFAARLGGLIQSAAFFLIFILFGFASGDNPGPNPGGASRFLLVAIPVTLMLIAFIVSLFMKKDAGGKEERNAVSDN